MSRPVDADVVVAGAGACGMVTALRASANPEHTVVVFEKSTRHGCNTEYSSGSLAAGGTRYQAAAGVTDSPQRHAEDILSVSGDPSSAELVHTLCAAAPRYIEWLAEELAHPVELGLDMPRAGQSVSRLHTDTGRAGGKRLVQTLRRAIAATPNITLVDNMPVRELLTDERQGVVGVQIGAEGAATERVSAGQVVLASDGFGNNPELIARHCPDATDAFYAGVSTSTGDAVRWAGELGVGLRNMSGFLGHGMVVVGHGTRLNPSLPFLGALLVDRTGSRFCAETAQGYSKLGSILRGLPDARAVLIWDEPAMRLARHSELMRESIAAKAFRRCHTVAQLAQVMGLPHARLTDTIERFPARSELVSRPNNRLDPPWYAAWITHGILTTQGGLAVDTSGRVLREDGSAVAGLSAGGGAAAGISGNSPDGYSSGNGLLAAMGLGWVIGNRVATGG